jgi:hypothetical protein
MPVSVRVMRSSAAEQSRLLKMLVSFGRKSGVVNLPADFRFCSWPHS